MDWVILGAVAVGGYLLYSQVVKPLEKPVQQAWHVVTTPGYQLIPEFVANVAVPGASDTQKQWLGQNAAGLVAFAPVEIWKRWLHL